MSNRHYQGFDKKQFEECLAQSGDGSRSWAEVSDLQCKKTWEYVYQHGFRSEVGQHHALKVYSSVEKKTGFSRPKNRDAIRICVVPTWRGHGASIIKTIVVKRTGLWRQNLLRALKEAAMWSHARLARGSPTAPEVAPATTQEVHDEQPWVCPQCGSNDTWFDRTITYDEQGQDEIMGTRCAKCGLRVGETPSRPEEPILHCQCGYTHLVTAARNTFQCPKCLKDLGVPARFRQLAKPVMVTRIAFPESNATAVTEVKGQLSGLPKPGEPAKPIDTTFLACLELKEGKLVVSMVTESEASRRKMVMPHNQVILNMTAKLTAADLGFSSFVPLDANATAFLLRELRRHMGVLTGYHQPNQ